VPVKIHTLQRPTFRAVIKRDIKSLLIVKSVCFGSFWFRFSSGTFLKFLNFLKSPHPFCGRDDTNIASKRIHAYIYPLNNNNSSSEGVSEPSFRASLIQRERSTRRGRKGCGRHDFKKEKGKKARGRIRLTARIFTRGFEPLSACVSLQYSFYRRLYVG